MSILENTFDKITFCILGGGKSDFISQKASDAANDPPNKFLPASLCLQPKEKR